MKFRLVLVEWVDSYRSPMEWSEIEAKPTALRCQSVGWIARESDECITIVPHWSDFEHGCGEMTIPRVAVKRIQDLTVTRRRKR